MKKNLGSADRAIRVIVALAFGILVLTGQISGVVATILGVLAVVLLATSLVGFCPLYAPFKISTKKEVAPQPR
jgi:hypothetical protein